MVCIGELGSEGISAFAIAKVLVGHPSTERLFGGKTIVGDGMETALTSPRR